MCGTVFMASLEFRDTPPLSLPPKCRDYRVFTCECVCSWRPEEYMRFPGTRVTGSRETSDVTGAELWSSARLSTTHC